MEWQKDRFWITTDKSKLDIPFIHSFLTGSYWAMGISQDIVQKCVDGSVSFGVFHEDQQIGFARVVTDKASFGYLADVFIDEAWRGQGLSKWLMEIIMEHPDLQGFRRFLLATRDAHGLYRQFGFTELNNPERWMQIHNPDVYKKLSN